MTINEVEDVGSFSTEAKANMRSRSHRRDDLLRLITKNGRTTSKDHILGIFMMRAHIGLSTTYEYIKELKMARLIVESGDQIMTTEQRQEEQDGDAKRLDELVAGGD